MTRLVVNADDLGLHPAIDRGILRAHREGIVTSATLLVRGTESSRAVREAKRQGLSLGLHLCVTTRLSPAAPPENVPSLLANGRFRANWASFVAALLLRRVRTDEIAEEFWAQLRLARVLGAEPDHLDGHQHVHVLPELREVLDQISQAEGLPVRWPREMPNLSWLAEPISSAKACVVNGLSFLQKRPAKYLNAIGICMSGKLNERRLIDELSRIGDGDYELICHPGEEPGIVPEDPLWRYAWTDELEALCSPRVREIIAQRGIQLTTYHGIFANSD